MARPQRNNVDYFPFYCEDGKKMYYLEETYGNDGFATFMKLLRELAKSDFHYLDLSKNTTTMFLSARCKVSKEKLELIINDLVELEKFDSVLWSENRVIWCQDFVDSIQDAYSKRNNDCITYNGLLLLLEGLGVRKPVKQPSTVPVKPQSIVEETIVEETIVEEKINKKPSVYFKNDELNDLFIRWMKMCGEKGKPFAQSQIEALQMKMNYQTDEKSIREVRQSLEKGWLNLRVVDEPDNKISAQDAEEMDIAILKHLRDVQSENDNTEPAENNRLRGIS